MMARMRILITEAGVELTAELSDSLTTAALYRHLLDHPEFMAGLEVWWEEPFVDDRFRVAHPFLELPNVLGCPHNSGIVTGSLDAGVQRAAENVRRFLLGEAIVGRAERDDYIA